MYWTDEDDVGNEDDEDDDIGADEGATDEDGFELFLFMMIKYGVFSE